MCDSLNFMSMPGIHDISTDNLKGFVRSVLHAVLLTSFR